DSARAQQPNRLDGADHPDDPVEAPAVPNGIGVRPCEDRPERGVRSFEAPDDVPRGIDRGAEAGLAHEPQHVLPLIGVHLTEDETGPAAESVVVKARERLEVPRDPIPLRVPDRATALLR